MTNRTSSWLAILIFVAVLVTQNLLQFSMHYLRDGTPPWDFVATYHAVPQFWIAAAQQGVSVAWVPFQGMGYPLYMNLQSGFYYPPFWYFVLTDFPYTLAAAVALQGLHVLFGAFGAALCARVLRMPWLLALLAGVLYQTFGGFYTNASHPDIVRAYALLPWLCAPVIAPWRASRAFYASLVLLPLWVYGLWTGSYPGGAIAVLFTLGCLTALRLAASRFSLEPHNTRRWGLAVGLTLVAGCLLAGISLVPAYLDKDYLSRASIDVVLHHDYAAWRDVFTLVWRAQSKLLGHDITMRSISIGLPALALLLLRPFLGQWRSAATLLTMGTLALGMVSGWLHQVLSTLLPTLGYSRFVWADYRGMLGLVAVLLAVQSLHLLRQRAQLEVTRQTQWLLVLGACLATTLVVMGNWQVTDTGPFAERVAFLLFAGLACVAVAYTVRTQHADSTTRLVWCLAALVSLSVLDWARLHLAAKYFYTRGAQAVLHASVGPFAHQQLTKTLVVPPSCRPGRLDIAVTDVASLPWRGYYTGQYVMQDYGGPMHLIQHQKVFAHAPSYAFAREPWTALELQGNVVSSSVEHMLSMQPAPVKCRQYGTDEVRLQVDLPQPALVVENEMYWPGWTAQTATGQTLQAINSHGFRAWALPAGNYELVARFRVPHRMAGILTSGLGLLMWFGLFLFNHRLRRKS